MADVRPLRWHDLPSAYRLVGRGIHLDSELNLTIGNSGLRHALLTGMGRTNFYFLRHPDGEALGQLHFPANTHHARLAYLSPEPSRGGHEGSLLAMLDGLAAMAGQRGMTGLIAEVHEQSDLLAILRQADFAIYARQDLWKREPAPVEASGIVLRPADSQDEIAMQVLYSALVPSLIQQVEDPPTSADACYVMEDKHGNMVAVVAVYRGARRALVEFYLHPEVQDQSGEVVAGALGLLNADTQVIYCRLRRYMGWLGHALMESGFQVVEPQAVMARHTAVRVAQPAFKPLKVNSQMSTIVETRRR